MSFREGIDDMENVCVVIVTYNRKELLLNLLKAIQNQTYPVREIVIVDNHSTDGTSEYLIENGVIQSAIENEITENIWGKIKVKYYLSSMNTGGSGGFEKVFQIACQLDYDYIWAMDDDIEPENDCLEILIDNIDKDSRVCIPSRNDDNWTDELVTHYNLKNPFLLNIKQYKTVINSLSIDDDVTIIVDMPLEGPLIAMDVVRRVGIPNSNYFIMFDDTDFAYRISKTTSIKYVKKARIHRKLAIPKQKNSEWTWKEYYLLRNSFVFDKYYGENMLVRYFRPFLSCTAKIASALGQKKFFRVKLIMRAYSDAIHNRLGKRIEPGTEIKTL